VYADGRRTGQRDQNFTERVRGLVLSVPFGRVATYGQIAVLAGNPGGARQVAWILHASSRKYGLPWHRIVNSRGGISLKPGCGYEAQRDLLMQENIGPDESGIVDLDRFLWNPDQAKQGKKRG